MKNKRVSDLTNHLKSTQEGVCMWCVTYVTAIFETSPYNMKKKIERNFYLSRNVTFL